MIVAREKRTLNSWEILLQKSLPKATGKKKQVACSKKWKHRNITPVEPAEFVHQKHRTKVKVLNYRISDGVWNICWQLTGEHRNRHSRAYYFVKQGLKHLKDINTFGICSQVSKVTKRDYDHYQDISDAFHDYVIQTQLPIWNLRLSGEYGWT